MGNGKPARFEIGKQRLDVAEHRLAGRRIAVVANRGVALEAFDDLAVSEIVADQSKGTVIVKLLAVVGNDPDMNPLKPRPYSSHTTTDYRPMCLSSVQLCPAISHIGEYAWSLSARMCCYC